MSLRNKIKSGEFVTLAELETPKGSDFSPLLAHANPVKGRIDAFVVPEMANAVMKASSLGGCAFLQSKGFETVMQSCCRDRNRLALQADVLSAAGVGIRNVMVVNGEEIKFGDHHRARAVYDVDQFGLLGGIRGLQSNRDMAGIELRGAPQLFVGSSLNAGATGGALDVELEELERKIQLGVEFIVTTPIFDVDRFTKMLKRLDTARVAVIPTVLLLKSAGMARYIDRNIRNISIPPDMILAIQKAPDKVRECVRIAGKIIGRVKEIGLAGVSISTIGWEEKLPLVLDGAKL